MKSIRLRMIRTLVSAGAALSLYCSGGVFAQDRFPALKAEEIPGLRLVREASYDGNSLWGYIDGGADVYLEYGFQKILARKAEASGVTFQIDLYRMKDAESAFGIFSISAFNCSPGDSLGSREGFECLSRYQAQAARGSWYLSVINDKGTPDAQRLGVRILHSLLAQIERSDTLRLPELFRLDPLAGPAKASVKFMKGPLGVQNGYPEFEKFFSDTSPGAFSLYIKEVQSDSLSMALALVSFASTEAEDHFITCAGFHLRPQAESVQQKREGRTDSRLWILPQKTLVYLEIKASETKKDTIFSAVDHFLKR